MNQRHTEFFGPDLGRGPFAASRLDAAALQIATALAQLRAPVGRADADVLAHGDFVRQLADRLAPDYAAYVSVSVGAEVNNNVQCNVRTSLSTYSLLDLWLADSIGGGLTATAPTAVTFSVGTVLETITDKKRYLVLTSATGVIDVTVNYVSAKTWYWAVTRLGRVFYSDRLYFI